MAERILLIEDDARLAEMVSEYLGEAGFRVSIASAGHAGLERLAREPFDAVVLDLMLPDMDGLEVCREVRAKSSPSMSGRSEEHTSELQSLAYLVCRLLLEKKKKKKSAYIIVIGRTTRISTSA